jgi:ankyrin repeat protein
MKRRFTSPEIIYAAERGDVEKVRSLLDVDRDQLRALSRIGNAAIHVAATHNRPKIVELLLDCGADVNMKGNRGMTPLHGAAEGGAVEVARLLLQRGADLEAVDDRGQTPLQIAATRATPSIPQTEELFRVLKEHGAEYDLRSAVLRKDLAAVRRILEKDPEAVSKIPKEPGLVYVAIVRKVDPELLQLLLEHGADPNAPPTALHRNYPLTYVSDPVLAELLLKYGAKLNVKNFQGITPIQRARKYKMKELEQVLLRYGAKVPKRTARKATKKRPIRAQASKPANTHKHKTKTEKRPARRTKPET